MPPLKYPTKPFFFMVAHYPEATPAEWILPDSMKPPKKKNIGSSTNNSTITCRMRYSQIVNSFTTPVLANGSTPTKKCMSLVY